MMDRWWMKWWSMACLGALVAALTWGCDSASDDDLPETEITVLFAYAESVVDSVDDITAHLGRAIDETNRVYRESRVPIRLVSVAQMPVTYSATDRFDLLAQLLDPADGSLDAVHVRRDEAEADVVVLVSELRSETVQAAIMARPETAFALVWWDGLGAPLYGVAHE